MFCSRAHAQVNFCPRTKKRKKEIYRFHSFTHKKTKMIILMVWQCCQTSLSGFICSRNKQGTEYCKLTVHISNRSPRVLILVDSFIILHFIVLIMLTSSHLSCFNDCFPHILVWLGLNSLMVWLCWTLGSEWFCFINTLQTISSWEYHKLISSLHFFFFDEILNRFVRLCFVHYLYIEL